ncbi:MAG: SH3 domain-containing protein [Methyloceanibacter sp.]
MTFKALVTALAVAFLALTLSTLPVQANNPTNQCIDTCAQCKDVPPYVDEVARSSGSDDTCKGGPVRYCCTPVPTTKTRDPAEERRACNAKPGHRYDDATATCKVSPLGKLDKIEPGPKGGAMPTCREGKVWSDSENACVFKTYKKMGRNNSVCAKNDVDIYNSPVEPRNVVGMMNGGTKGTIVERHPDGWYKIQGYGWIANNHLGSCP